RSPVQVGSPAPTPYTKKTYIASSARRAADFRSAALRPRIRPRASNVLQDNDLYRRTLLLINAKEAADSHQQRALHDLSTWSNITPIFSDISSHCLGEYGERGQQVYWEKYGDP